MAEEAGAPLPNDILLEELEKPEAHKASSAGPIDFAKRAKSSLSKLCGRICCLIFTLVLVAVLLLALPIADTVIGAMHVKDCPARKHLPIYLIVTGILGLVLGILLCWTRVKSHRDKLQDPKSGVGLNAASGCIGSFIGAFLLTGFIAANVYVFRKDACAEPVSVNSTHCVTHNADFASSSIFCDETFYKFVLWEIIAKWIIIGVILGLGCLGCCVVGCCSKQK